jgi:hypothetical protein
VGSHRCIGCGLGVHDVCGLEIHEEAEEMTRNTPIAIVALPALIGATLAIIGSKAGTSRSGVSGMGTDADDATTRNLQLAQQYQSSALTGTLTMLGLLLTPVLSAVGIIWMLRRSSR